MAQRAPTDVTPSGFVRQHAADLHRTALMLTADTARADALVRSVISRLTQQPEARGPVTADQARDWLVREYLRTARRHRFDRPAVARPATDHDAGDVLSGMRPRVRAACVLRLVHGWSADQIARAVRVRPAKIPQLTPEVAGLKDALEGVATRHARPEQELVAELLTELSPDPPATGRTPATGPAPPRRTSTPYLGLRRAWRWVVAATLALALAATGWALTRTDDSAPETDRVLGLDGIGLGLNERGWVLDDKGEPPRGNEGLQLVQSVTIDYRRATAPVELTGNRHGRIAKFAVLWCELPAVDDPNLIIPELTLTFAQGQVTLPCAGRDGQPPVRQLTPAPAGDGASSQDVGLTWEGDLPGRGEAVLAFYQEPPDDGSLFQGAPTSVEVGAEHPPALATGAVSLSPDSVSITSWLGRNHVSKMEIGHDSKIRAWVGTSTAISLTVDGHVLTDDGDLDSRLEPWRDQDPALRDGVWLVHEPDQTRTFELPEAVRPAPGQRRTVVLSAFVDEGAEDRWQVQVTNATMAPTDPVILRAAGPGTDPSTQGPAPEYVGGYRFLARWEVPADGYPYVLEPGDQSLERVTFATVGRPDMSVVPRPGTFGGTGTVESEFGMAALFYNDSVSSAMAYQSADPWAFRGLEGPSSDQLRAALPPIAGAPMTSVWAYTPVSYEDFDFASAPPLPGSWAVGDDAPSLGGQGTRRSLGHGSAVQDGLITFDGKQSPRFAQVTTRGAGRLRFLVDGEPILGHGPDWSQWWSSWTAEPVTTEVYLSETRFSARDLTVEVEGYDDGVQIELFNN